MLVNRLLHRQCEITEKNMKTLSVIFQNFLVCTTQLHYTNNSFVFCKILLTFIAFAYIETTERELVKFVF